MNGILSRYIFVVTICLFIPLNYACINQSLAAFMSCASDIIPKSGTITKDQAKYESDYMCSEDSKAKEKLRVCIRMLTDCEQFVSSATLFGIDITRMNDASDKLCKHKKDYLSGMPYLSEVVSSMTTHFESVFQKAVPMIVEVLDKKITSQRYFEQYCPLLKQPFDKIATDSKYPETYAKVLQDVINDLMTDECQDINSDGIIMDFQMRLELVQCYYACGRSPIQEIREYKKQHCLIDNPCTPQALTKLIKEFETNYTLHDIPISGRTAFNKEERIVAIETAVETTCNEQGSTSIRSVSKSTGIPKSTVHNLMCHEMKLYPYKLQVYKEIIERDMQSRLNFAK